MLFELTGWLKESRVFLHRESFLLLGIEAYDFQI